MENQLIPYAVRRENSNQKSPCHAEGDLGGGSLRGKAEAIHNPCHTEGNARSISDSQSEDSLESRDISVVSLPQYDKETNSPSLASADSLSNFPSLAEWDLGGGYENLENSQNAVVSHLLEGDTLNPSAVRRGI